MKRTPIDFGSNWVGEPEPKEDRDLAALNFVVLAFCALVAGVGLVVAVMEAWPW